MSHVAYFLVRASCGISTRGETLGPKLRSQRCRGLMRPKHQELQYPGPLQCEKRASMA
jgi:hypothetical protein